MKLCVDCKHARFDDPNPPACRYSGYRSCNLSGAHLVWGKVPCWDARENDMLCGKSGKHWSPKP